MAVAPDTLTFDCASPLAVARFWGAAFDYVLSSDSDDEDGAYLADPSGRTRGLFFQRVAEPRTAKNRLHLDVRPSGTMQEEVDRLVGLGATVRGFVEKAASAVDGQPTFWAQMADVEGNEFCVLRGPGDGWQPGEL
jgi:hypothetical protein